MSTRYSWEHYLEDILRVVNPTEDDWNKRVEVIDNLKALVESLEILRGATVEPFGSFMSNLFTRWSDLDISIELPNGTYISTVGKKFKEGLISDIQQSLITYGGFRGIKSFYNVKVPTLKCYTKKSNISCNISINNLKGHMKSKILLWLNTIDGRCRDMLLLVKEWAKTHCINDSKTGTLSSYSLSLLVIFHFQTCEPAILPPLNEIYQGNMADDLYGVRVAAEQNIERICRGNINRIKSDTSRTINRSSLAKLFISFLEKFSDIDLRAAEQGISPYNGQWEYIEDNMIWQPKTYQLFIEDPFEQPLNCARGVNGQNLRKIAEAFKRSLNKLTSPNQNRAIDVLVRPEILSMMSRQPGLSLDNIGMNHPTNRGNPVNKPYRNHVSNGGPVVARGGLESGPMNQVDKRPGLRSNGRKNRVDRNNGFGGRRGQVAMGEVERVRTSHDGGSGRAQQRWKLKSDK